MPETLKNKKYIDYRKLSRYNNFPTYYHTKNNKYSYSTIDYLDNETPYTIYATKSGDTLDELALRFYNNPTYFWIIGLYNRIEDIYAPLEEGIALKIPSMSALKFSEQLR